MIGLFLNLLRAIPFREWLLFGLAVSLFAYHEIDKHQAVTEAKAETAQRYEKAIVDANTKAKADHDALQAQVDRQAGPSNADIQRQFAQIKNDLASIGKLYGPKNPLPTDCKLDAERVRLANAALTR